MDKNDNRFICSFCNLEYLHKSSLSRHKKNTCIFNPEKGKNQTITLEQNNKESPNNNSLIQSSNNTITNTNTTNNKYINIYIDGVKITEDILKRLDMKKPENIDYIINTFASIQRPFGHETTDHLTLVDIKPIFKYVKYSALIPFREFLPLFYNTSKNKNIAFFNCNKPQITMITKYLEISKNISSTSELNKELDNITNVITRKFLEIYHRNKQHLTEEQIEKMQEFEDIINKRILFKNEFIDNFRIKHDNEYYMEFPNWNELTTKFMFPKNRNDEEFERTEQYTDYLSQKDHYELKKDLYESKYKIYEEKIKQYSERRKMIVKTFIEIISCKHTPKLKKHIKTVSEIQNVNINE